MTDTFLYIIGNGFDLHHGIHSSYRYFRAWLQTHDRNLYRMLVRLCPAEVLWWNFEEALAHLNRSFLLDSASIWLPDNWDEDKDSYSELYYAEDHARNDGENLWDDIVKAFRKWVYTIKWEKDSDSKKLMLDTYARFITFNYTTFLESRYGVDRKQILYIHGKQTDSKNPPIIGHRDIDTFDEWYKTAPKRYKKYYQGVNSYLPEVSMMTEGIENYFEVSKKPVSRIITQHKDFFLDLYDIDNIYVLGHSLNDVDMPYIQTIMNSMDYPEECHWHISYFSKSEKKRRMNSMRKLGVCDANMEFFHLYDIMLSKN